MPESPFDPIEQRNDELARLWTSGEHARKQFESDCSTIYWDQYRKKIPPDGKTWEEWLEQRSLPLKTWLEECEPRVTKILDKNQTKLMRAHRNSGGSYKQTPERIPKMYEDSWRDAYYKLEWLKDRLDFFGVHTWLYS